MTTWLGAFICLSKFPLHHSSLLRNRNNPTWVNIKCETEFPGFLGCLLFGNQCHTTKSYPSPYALCNLNSLLCLFTPWNWFCVVAGSWIQSNLYKSIHSVVSIHFQLWSRPINEMTRVNNCTVARPVVSRTFWVTSKDRSSTMQRTYIRARPLAILFAFVKLGECSIDRLHPSTCISVDHTNF